MVQYSLVIARNYTVGVGHCTRVVIRHRCVDIAARQREIAWKIAGHTHRPAYRRLAIKRLWQESGTGGPENSFLAFGDIQ